jgi:hypothetical protein
MKSFTRAFATTSFLLLLGTAVSHHALIASATDKATSARPTNNWPASSKDRIKAQASQTLFDDFNYSNHADLEKHGWIVRTADGWPGIPGASWRKEGVSFIKDADQAGNRIIRMTSTTDGTSANTTQTQICQQRKFMEGTYAARVRFVDAPVSGPAGDQIVESFYTISPLKAPMDPDYSELDFEYLPNGGWGSVGSTLYVTSWRTFSPEPNWQKDNVFYNTGGSKAGWHTLVTQVSAGKVKYYIDGVALAEHGGQYYPRSIMSINFNLWFIKDQTVKSKDKREYQEDIDWVFHEKNSALTPLEVETKVAAMRKESVRFKDTVPAPSPALVSPCNF